MSGDNLYGGQPLKFYSEEMTETKMIALAYYEKKLFSENNSIIHLKRRHQEINAPEMACKVPDAA